jgi:glutamate/aspartate transport system substrate-binding protein
MNSEKPGGWNRVEGVIMRCAIVTLLAVVLSCELASAQALDGRLKTIQETATLKLAYRTDSRPFAFVDRPGGRPLGYSIELCERVAKHLETELGLPKLDVKWVQVDTRTRFDAVANGDADIECGSTTMSLSRMKIVDFSTMIYAESTGVLIKSGTGIFRFDDLGGKRIGVIAGSTNARAIRDQLERRRLAATLIEFRDREEGVASLARGDLDGFASDKLVLLALAQAANLRDFVLLPDDLSFEPFALILPRGDWAFRLAVNTGLARLFRTGEIVELYTKFFSGFASQPSPWIGALFTFGALPE